MTIVKETLNNTLSNVICMKEHTVNKIPIVVSVRKFMISGSQAIAVFSLSR